MEKESILFFQELYQNSISQEKILFFCKHKQFSDMQEKAIFLQLIMMSDEASSVKDKYEFLIQKIGMIREPEDLLGIRTSFKELIAQSKEYMLSTMRALDKRIFMPEEIKMLHPLFSNYAAERIEKMITFALYYLICQSGLDVTKIVGSYVRNQAYESSNIEQSISLYNELMGVIKQGSIAQWKYVLKQIEFDKLGEMPQFFVDKSESFGEIIVPGKPSVYYKKVLLETVLVVEGKGYLTNINPKEDHILEKLTGAQCIMSEAADCRPKRTFVPYSADT